MARIALEALRSLGEKAEPGLRDAQQEQPLDPFLLVLGLQPFEKQSRFLPPFGLHEHTHHLQDGDADRLRSRLL